MSAYRSGDYATALDKVEELKAGEMGTAPYYFFRGSILRQLGRLKEAEEALRQALFLEKYFQQQALASNTLAVVLCDQRRFKEAIEFYELASRAWPDRGASLRGIAEVLLYEGQDLARALEMSRRAVEIDRRAHGLPKKILDERLGEDISVLAWAGASNGHNSDDTASLLTKAFHLCESSSIPVRAQQHYHAGRAFLLLSNTDEAREHLAKAAGIDPQGTYGRRALSALTGTLSDDN
jgi:tetratricopeptide (TPR) repeat protein